MSEKADTRSGSASAPDTRPILEVAAGIVHRPLAGRPGHWEVLMGQRPPGKAYAGWWEFPGGKIEAGESVTEALARELQEELDLTVLDSRPWLVREHSYPHARVRLHFQRIFEWRGEPRSMEAQDFAWQPLDRIVLEPLLPASLPLLEMLRWPARLGLHGFDARVDPLEDMGAILVRAQAHGIDRVLFQFPDQSGVTATADVTRFLIQAAERGLKVYPDQVSFEALKRSGCSAICGGYWRRENRAGMDVLEVWVNGGLFSATSVSNEDDLRRSEQSPPQASGDAWSLQAFVVVPANDSRGQVEAFAGGAAWEQLAKETAIAQRAKGAAFARLAKTTSAPLYWPDARLLALGGHGLAQAI